MKREIRDRGAVLTLVLAFLCAGLVFVAGCGGDEEEVPPAVVGEPGAAVEPAPEEPAAVGQAEPVVEEEAYLPDAPVVLPVLRLRPDSAVFSMAIPSIASLYEIGTGLVTRYMPPEQVGAAVSQWTSEVAVEFGVPSAETPMDIARLRGFDPAAPVALYAEFSQFAAAMEEAVKKAQAAKPPSATAEPNGPADTPESPPAESAAPDAPLNEDAFDEAFVESLTDQPPAVVVAWKALDVLAAENSLKELYAEYLQETGGAAGEETIESDGVTIHLLGNGRFAYAFADDRVFAGTSAPMIKECLARLDSPAPLSYGTAAMPSVRRDEVVYLIEVERLLEQVERLLPLLSELPGSEGLEMQRELFDRWGKYYSGEEPLVSMLAVIPAEDAKPPVVLARSIAQRSKYPGMQELLGEVKPLRLAPLMPEKTQLLVAQQFTPLTKQMMRDQWTSGIPPEARQEPMTAQALATMDQALELIGDELALSVSPTDVGLPGILLLVGLTDAEKAKTQIQAVVPTTVGEEYKGVQILNVAYPIPMITVSMAYVGNDLVVGTDLALIKASIDRLKGETPPALFAALDPPLDPSVPRQGVVLIKSQLLIDVVIPLSAFAGGLGEAQKPVDAITDVLQELRVTSDVTEQLYESQVVFYLK